MMYSGQMAIHLIYYSSSLGGQLKALVDIRDGCNGEIESVATNEDGSYKLDKDGNIITELILRLKIMLITKVFLTIRHSLTSLYRHFLKLLTRYLRVDMCSDASTEDEANKGIPLLLLVEAQVKLTASTSNSKQ